MQFSWLILYFIVPAFSFILLILRFLLALLIVSILTLKFFISLELILVYDEMSDTNFFHQNAYPKSLNKQFKPSLLIRECSLFL
jgi:hypothetical protein